MKMTADLKLATKYQITHKLSSAQITIVILYSIRKHHSKCLSNSPFSLFCRNYFVRLYMIHGEVRPKGDNRLLQATNPTRVVPLLKLKFRPLSLVSVAKR